MQLGMIGLGRMGTGMVRRLLRDVHDCVVHDTDAARVDALASEGARGAASLGELAAMVAAPRAIWMMVPVARVGPMRSPSPTSPPHAAGSVSNHAPP